MVISDAVSAAVRGATIVLRRSPNEIGHEFDRQRREREREEEEKRKQQPPADPCAPVEKAFFSCTDANSGNVAECQTYYSALEACRQRTPVVDRCAFDLQTFNDCVTDNLDRPNACEYYFKILQECRQRHT